MRKFLIRLLILAALAALVNLPEAEDDPVVLRPVPCQAGDIFVPDDPHGTLDSGSLACNGKPRNC